MTPTAEVLIEEQAKQFKRFFNSLTVAQKRKFDTIDADGRVE